MNTFQGNSLPTFTLAWEPLLSAGSWAAARGEVITWKEASRLGLQAAQFYRLTGSQESRIIHEPGVGNVFACPASVWDEAAQQLGIELPHVDLDEVLR